MDVDYRRCQILIARFMAEQECLYHGETRVRELEVRCHDSSRVVIHDEVMD